MTALESNRNTPALAWAWLHHRLAQLDAVGDRSIGREWSRFRNERDGRSTDMASIVMWPPDFWVAKSQHARLGTLLGSWSVPEAIDEWPSLGLRDGQAIPGGRPTNSRALAELRAGTDPTPTPALASTGAARRFLDLDAAATAEGGAAASSASQVRAWVMTALGGLLGGIAFTPVEDAETSGALVRLVGQRLTRVDSLPTEFVRPSFADYGCTALYNAFMTESGIQLDVVRQGQGTDWRELWRSLSASQDAQAMDRTLQLTGLLLINETLLAGLVAAMQTGDDNVQKRALCVARRWMLTTRVLTWLVQALRHPWSEVRPSDLACFAFGALAPVWPRRTVAVSHRSHEVKPVMSGLSMWRSPHASIDATYVPAWETNTGMIWSLFAPVPLVTRVISPQYFASLWCRREHELLQYLVDHSDFLDRTVVDVGVDALPGLDGMLFTGPQAPLPAPQLEFPPLTLGLLGQVTAGLETALLRAAAALRLINLLVRSPPVANEIAAHAAAGIAIDLGVPTNNPDGWEGYGRIFRELQDLLPARAGGLSLWLPDDYPVDAVQHDLANAERIVDLSDGRRKLGDVLAALEWQASIYTWFRNEDLYGDTVVVDVSDVRRDEWTTDTGMSIGRGLLGVSGDSPVWIMQQRGQDVHEWPGVDDNPIFTRHTPEQFTWLKPVVTKARWLIYYMSRAGLGVGGDLQSAMIKWIAEADGRDALQTEEHPDGVGLVVPLPNEIFAIPTEALGDMTAFLGGPTDPPT